MKKRIHIRVQIIKNLNSNILQNPKIEAELKILIILRQLHKLFKFFIVTKSPLNSGRVTLTSGKLNISDGELKTIDVESGNVRIGEKGIDALSLTDLELVAKKVDIDGIVKGSKDTKVRISAGGQTYEYKTKEVTSKGKTYRGIAVDGKRAGSMYAGKIDIISNDRGAGVNTKGDLVSIDDVTITANGEITTEKAHSTKRVVYKTPKKVRIRKQVTAGEKVVVKAKKTEVDVNAQIITGYLFRILKRCREYHRQIFPC